MMKMPRYIIKSKLQQECQRCGLLVNILAIAHNYILPSLICQDKKGIIILSERSIRVKE